MQLDFQGSFYGSPAADILYFIYGSCNEDVFWNNRHELIEYYHNNLTQILESLNYVGYAPSLQELEREIDICNFMGTYYV